MRFPEAGEHTTPIDPVAEYATIGQKAKIFFAEHWPYISGPFIRTVVEAEIFDRLDPDGADPDITPKALHGFYKKLLDAPSEERYGLLAKPTPGADPEDPNCRVWFDAIEGLTNSQIIHAVAKTARDILPENKPRWNHALDLGAGTGQLGALLLGDAERSAAAENIALVDQVPELLAVAARRYGKAMNYEQGNALQLPFADASADLIVSGGLVYSLGQENQSAFFSEISRVLEPGGVYLDGDQSKLWGITKNTGRLALNWLIKGAVSGPEVLGDPLINVNKLAYFAGFELELTELTQKDPASESLITIRTLTKTS